MSIHVALTHRTEYSYDRPVTLSPQVIRLRPAPHAKTRVLSYSLKIEPDPHFLNWQQDPHSNWQARVVFPEKVTKFQVTVDLVAEMAAYNPFDFFVEPSADTFPFRYDEALVEDLKPFLRPARVGRRLEKYLKSVPRKADKTIDFLVEINQTLQQHVKYLIRMEPGVQTPEETLTAGSGSCRDSAWLLVQILRNLGLAARFVSGYLIQLKPDVKSLDGPSGAEFDFTDLHAWTEVYLPGAGWVGLDPTSGLLTAEGHIPLSATPEPASAAPISGAVDECEVEFGHHMDVRRLYEAPRVTQPYRETQWADVDALGAAVETKLNDLDVRLTMGGEPTFVSLDDMQGEEWNIAAVGPTKQKLAYDLLLRLRDRFAPDGLISYGQGKWYPGESLPRWVYTLYWRGDGKPMWTTPLPEDAKSATNEMAERFILGLAKRLSVAPENVLPAYEDAYYYMHRERLLPNNVDAIKNKLGDPEERARLSRVFERGLDAPRGYVLPVQRWQALAGRPWISERWNFRNGNLLLIPGDSPIGLRMPLDALPWLPAAEYPFAVVADPTRQVPPLPDRDPSRQPFLQSRGQPDARSEQRLTEERRQPKPEPRGAHYQGGNVRTALSVEARDGRINLFMPPVETTEDFLDLIAAAEDVAAEIGAPLRIEGYPAPSDGRLNLIKITPDPGVIEVNIHPAHSWEELRENTLAIYEEARLSRLTTEKFLIDGRAVGTGGGNHIVVGAAHPSDSPFLRRPDVLASMIRFWQNHPSLSYLFSGMFIGPTSQHPRIDEGRDSQLYEVELALSEIPEPGGAIQPWLVDRILRNLLIDLTGNTHRTEICIDKLYAPESATGRLGLVEFRGFEMPPHPLMSLTQQLLVRALIAWFWEQPYKRPLVRWGTQLHDRFMLPHYVWQDFKQVLEELQLAGYPFESSWFDPHFEFRFPRHGSVQFGDIELELRHALEPWPVLGEEAGGGGTSRYVDSSLERLQVRASGLNGDRYWVACNGRAVPLAATGTEGESVAGVRYRAWQPWSCLHPTIGMHAPLTFDLYDTWNRRAVSGCVYHVAHPAGRNYETFPINGLEAESRRLSRFERQGQTPSYYDCVPPAVDREYPCTLDLRKRS